MAGINKVIIVGRLGNDPEMRTMPNGDSVANMSLATSEVWNDKNTGERREVTEWHRIVLYRRNAEVAGQYLRKGSQVYIEGQLKTRKWQDQQGQDHYTTEIHANSLTLIDSKPTEQQTQSTNSNQNNAYAKAKGGKPSQHQTPKQEFDDDIPF